MKIKCPNCNTVFEAPDEYGGRQIKCLNCKQLFATKPLEIKNEHITENSEDLPVGKNPDGFLIWVSFLIPLAGIIIGAIFVSKPKQAEKDTGSACLIAAVIGFFVGSVIIGLMCL